MTEEEIERIKNFKIYTFEWDVYVKAEDYHKKVEENKLLKMSLEEKDENCYWLRKENDELKEENEKLANLISYIMAREWIQYIEKDGEGFTIKWFESIQDIIEENRKLKKELSIYDREYFDEDKKYKSQKKNILMGKI